MAKCESTSDSPKPLQEKIIKAFFFGTFDPVHIGHIKIAQSVKEQFGFERVIFVPTPVPPHKNTQGASFFDRFEMLKLAAGEENVSDIETKIEPPNYTYKTVEKLDSIDNGVPVGAFILGSDQFEKIENWKNADYLKKMLEFIVIGRNITDTGRFAPHMTLDAPSDFAHLRKKGYNFNVAHFEPIDVSSTQIRNAVKNGKDISGLVDKKVENYIYAKKLYS